MGEDDSDRTSVFSLDGTVVVGVVDRETRSEAPVNYDEK